MIIKIFIHLHKIESFYPKKLAFSSFDLLSSLLYLFLYILLLNLFKSSNAIIIFIIYLNLTLIPFNNYFLIIISLIPAFNKSLSVINSIFFPSILLLSKIKNIYIYTIIKMTIPIFGLNF